MLHAYYDFRDELTVQDQLVFKGQMLIVPAGMRKEMLAGAHATHIGMEGWLSTKSTGDHVLASNGLRAERIHFQV